MGALTLGVAAHAQTLASTHTLVEPGADTLLEAVAAAQAGDTLVLAPGLYLVTQTVLINKDLTIKGKTGDPKDVNIVAVEEFNFQESEPPFDVEINRGHILFACNGIPGCEQGASRVVFTGFTVKRAPESPPFDTDAGACTEAPPFGLGLNLTECFGDGIHTDGVAEVVVRRVEASLNAGNGMYVIGANSAKFREVVGINNGAFGIDVDTALDLSIKDSTFIANQVSGMEASGHPPAVLTRAEYTANVSISDTLAKGNGEIGIEVERFQQAKLKRVACTDNREDGFDADRVGTVAISDSKFINNLDDGLELFPVNVVPGEQPTDFPGSIVEIYDHLKFAGNVAQEIDHAPTEN